MMARRRTAAYYGWNRRKPGLVVMHCDAIKALREMPWLWLHAGVPWPGGGQFP
jgi:hypothetical protein